MKTNIIVSLITSAVLGASAPLVFAQEEVPTIGGVPVTTAVAVGIVGATIIGAAVDDDDNAEDPISPPTETEDPVDPPVETVTPPTTTATGTGA